jgi:hypothetical protein
MAVIGNTIRIKGDFMTWAGSKADAVNPQLLVYEGNSTEPSETFDLTEANHIGVGEYQYDYTVGYGKKELVFGITGLVEGTRETGRITEAREWINII